MGLENFERQLKELESIKYYEHVKADRDRLATKNEEFRKDNSVLSKRLEEAVTHIKELEAEVGSKAKEIEDLRSKVEKLEKDNVSLRDTTRQIGKNKLTLPQLRELVAKIKAEEIDEEAQRRFIEHKSKWENEEKPKQLSAEASKILADVIEILESPEPHNFPKDIVDLGLPDKVEKRISSQVKRGLDQEFYRRVEQNSDRIALEKLERLRKVEWPKWKALNFDPKIAELEALIRSNIINVLKGFRTITCDKCGQSFGVELTNENMEYILRLGHVSSQCPNPSCTDPFLLWTRRHTIRLSLKYLIEDWLSLGH